MCHHCLTQGFRFSYAIHPDCVAGDLGRFHNRGAKTRRGCGVVAYVRDGGLRGHNGGLSSHFTRGGRWDGQDRVCSEVVLRHHRRYPLYLRDNVSLWKARRKAKFGADPLAGVICYVMLPKIICANPLLNRCYIRM